MSIGSSLLEELLENQYEKSDLGKIYEGFKSKRKTTFRVNTIKSNCEEIENELEKNSIKFEKPSWSCLAYILDSENEEKIKEFDIYKSGKIYFQSLSSMLPPIILNPKEGKDILDMASAPGGKTTQIASITNNKAHITACEMNKIRCERLKYNIEKQGATSVYIMQKDARKIDDFFSFDQILLDAPCTGSGTICLNKEFNFKKEFLEKISKTQRTLLSKAINILKKGEEMVYSTCSILYEENEKNIEEILKRSDVELVPIKFDKMEEVPTLKSKLEGTLLVAPNDLYEGFFVAKLKKKF